MERTKTSGKVTFQDKSVYIGELENEIPNGYGVWTHPNGEEYKGQWANGKENGSGILVYDRYFSNDGSILSFFFNKLRVIGFNCSFSLVI